MKKFTIVLLLLIFTLTLSSCKKKGYEDYMDTFSGFDKTIGDLTNDESIENLKLIYNDETAVDLKVLPVELRDDFIFGVDMSSIIAVEEAGGVFYNELGEEQDVFEILAEHGINYVRIRLWHHPFNDEGEPFGGGNNDTEVGIKIAKRAARVGMRIALDFHYSDFWADPGKQKMPRAWDSLNDSDLKAALYQYTYDTIKEFEKEGVRPHMVQIGNEINPGLLFPKGRLSIYGFDKVAEFLKEGLRAVNDISPDILTVIHLAEGASEQRMTYFFDGIAEYDVEFDIIGLSYYSFWHGPLHEFEETLRVLEEKYDQDIAIMEYSYGYTDYSNEFSSNIYSSGFEADGGYNTSMQGQVSYIRDVNNAIASIESGIGSFYWEPAWLAVDGAGWAEDGAIEYLEAQGDAVGIGNASWANQALFSFTGKVLPTIKVFDEMSTSTFDNEQVLSYEDEMNIILNIRSNDTLPQGLIVYTNLDRRTTMPITWNQAEVDAMTEAGDYIVHGSVQNGTETLEITCYVEAYANYFENPSFEAGGKVSNDVSDFSKVDGWDVTSTVADAVRVESKNARTVDNQGFNNLNIWAGGSYDFTLYQTITLQPGTYEYSVWARSADNIPPVSMFVRNGATDIKTQEVLYGASWSQWIINTFTFTITEETTVTIGIEGDCPAASWAHFEDFSLRETD